MQKTLPPYFIWSILAAISVISGVALPAFHADAQVHKRVNSSSGVPPLAESPTEHSNLQLEKREDWLARLYELTEVRLNESGYEVEIEITNFDHIFPTRFGEVHVYDVETRKAGWVVNITPVTQTHTYRSGEDILEIEQKKYFKAVWTMEKDWTKNNFTSNMASSTLAEAFEASAGDDPRYDNVELATTFKVHLTLEDRERSYRAAAYWLDSQGEEAEETWDLSLGDRVLNNVEATFEEGGSKEETQQAPSSEPEKRSIVGRDESNLLSESAPIQINSNGCDPFDKTIPSSDQLPIHGFLNGTEEHVDGELSEHQASLSARFNCSCSSDCTSSCKANIENHICNDFGTVTPGRQHDVASDLAISTDTVANALTQGASCQAMIGCAIRSCSSLSSCDAAISLKVSGASITISNSSSTYGLSINHPVTCPRCEEVTDLSPIVIDVMGDGLHFTGLEMPVLFDMDGDGNAESLSWTVKMGDEAFLFLDRNRNGRVDDGLELFGNHTAQPAHPDPNGFLALAVFDQPLQGGNGDGWITVADDIFRALRLWQDRNRDGVSQPEELQALGVHGVDAIELDYIEAKRRDAPGNQLRWASKVRFGDALRLSAVDVIFLEEK